MQDIKLARPVAAIGATDGHDGLVERWGRRVTVATGLFVIWFLCRPYAGIVHDARIYIGRGIADLNPGGLGGDLAFVYDGQSKFSIFPKIVALLVSALGPGNAALLLTIAGLFAWLASSAFLFSRVVKGPPLITILICLAALPSLYGGFGTFHWAEPFVTPRVLSEAAGLAALAFLIDDRKLLALGLIGIGGILHPLMAIPVIGVSLVLLAYENLAWLAILPIGALATLIAVAANLPIAGRLFEHFDPAWREVVAIRDPYLFPRLWGTGSWALVVCQLSTLLLAAAVGVPKLRRMIIAITIVAAVGTAVAAAVPTVLVVQMQTWRALWLVSCFAAAVFGLVAVEFWRLGGKFRAALAWLVVAWVAEGEMTIVAASCAAAICLWAVPIPVAYQRPLAIASWTLSLLFTAAMLGAAAFGSFRLYAHAPPGAFLSVRTLLKPSIHAALLVELAVLIGLGSIAVRGRLAALALSLSALIAVALVLAFWDARTPSAIAEESGLGAARLRSTMSSGSIQWLSSPGATWLWTMRPEWWSDRQGAGTVFNRQLALEWDRRFNVLLQAGLVLPEDKGFSAGPSKPRRPTTVTLVGLSKLCKAPGGPDWFVAPVERLDHLVIPEITRTWRAPQPEYWFDPIDRRWNTVQTFAIFSCADVSRAS